MTALLFGSISTLADTSERQREAFNEAFAVHGLDWRWDRDDYREMLRESGGADRVAAYAERVGADVDAAAIHATKSERFREGLADTPPELRPGVAETVRAARDAGLRLGLVTTTAEANVTALLDGLRPALGGDFDVVVDAGDVDAPKPDPAAYRHALDALGEPAAACVAVEDNVGGVRAARSAGVPCVAFPNENTADHDFAAADTRVERLTLDDLRPLAA